MAVYKVPQDVEADDKLIGPFSFRQFLYLIVVALAGFIAWALSRLFIPLAIIPLPVILLFGALALPLRKDQPMEIYLAAILSFFLKPHNRMWDPDGIESLIEITVPKTIEVQRIKNISRNEAEQRFGYLAELVDSQGWAVRGVGAQAPNSAMTSDAYFAAQQTEDILDDGAPVSQSLDYMINLSDQKRHKDMMDRINNSVPTQPVTLPPEPPVPSYDVPQTVNPYDSLSQTPSTASTPAPLDEDTSFASPVYNPYPNIQQTIIQPLGDQHRAQVQPSTQVSQQNESLQTSPQTTPSTTSEKKVSPDIMNLANNADLSIETIAREANRIHAKEESEEVVISLR